MKVVSLSIPEDVDQALELLRDSSRTRPTLVFKMSPICPISERAEAQFRHWLERGEDRGEVGVVFVDVIDQRPMARGLTQRLDVNHESPQLLLFLDGELSWHDSHDSITVSTLDAVAAEKFRPRS